MSLTSGGQWPLPYRSLPAWPQSPGRSQIRAYTNAVKQAMAQRDDAMMQELASRYLDVQRTVAARSAALVKDIAELRDSGVEVTAGRLHSLEEWQNLQVQLAQQFAGFLDYAEPALTTEQAARLRAGYEAAKTQLAMMGPRAALQSVALQSYPADTMNAILANTAGGPLADLLARSYAPMEQTIAQKLVEGVLNGSPVADIAHDAADATGVGLDRIFTIARTEENRAYRDGALQGYRDSGIVTGYIRMSARDEYVCIGCLVADGTEYDVDMEFDDHPNCRCTCVPKIEGVAAPSWPSSEDWFNSQPEDVQRSIMGPGRLDWYQTFKDDDDIHGETAWDSLATRKWDDTWGGAIVGTNLRDLEAGGGGIPLDGSPTGPPLGSPGDYIGDAKQQAIDDRQAAADAAAQARQDALDAAAAQQALPTPPSAAGPVQGLTNQVSTLSGRGLSPEDFAELKATDPELQALERLGVTVQRDGSPADASYNYVTKTLNPNDRSAYEHEIGHAWHGVLQDRYDTDPVARQLLSTMRANADLWPAADAGSGQVQESFARAYETLVRNGGVLPESLYDNPGIQAAAKAIGGGSALDDLIAGASREGYTGMTQHDLGLLERQRAQNTFNELFTKARSNALQDAGLLDRTAPLSRWAQAISDAGYPEVARFYDSPLGQEITERQRYLELLDASGSEGGGDALHGLLNEALGYDALPTLLPADTTPWPPEGERWLHRGVHEMGPFIPSPDGSGVVPTRYAADLVKDFREGPFYPGFGIYGNGTYTVMGTGWQEVVGSYSHGDVAGVFDMALKADARLVMNDDINSIVWPLQDALKDLCDLSARNAVTDADDMETWRLQDLKGLLQDPGRLATALGYDGIDVPQGQGQHYIVLLNRGAVSMLEVPE